jgi:hypothetical protein
MKKISEDEIISHIEHWLGRNFEKNDYNQIYAMVISLLERIGYKVER